jgi:hypothetical protein
MQGSDVSVHTTRRYHTGETRNISVSKSLGKQLLLRPEWGWWHKINTKLHKIFCEINCQPSRFGSVVHNVFWLPVLQNSIYQQGTCKVMTWTTHEYTRWFKYDRNYLCVNKSQFVPVIFEPPCNKHTSPVLSTYTSIFWQLRLVLVLFGKHSDYSTK